MDTDNNDLRRFEMAQFNWTKRIVVIGVVLPIIGTLCYLAAIENEAALPILGTTLGAVVGFLFPKGK